LALSLAASTPVWGQQVGDAAAGGRLVEAVCAVCHDPAGGRRAPAFAAVAAMPSTTAASLGVFLRTSHSSMPNLMLTQTERDDVIAYILSLRK
jgi:mono/diheme cytochrome c family protein